MISDDSVNGLATKMPAMKSVPPPSQNERRRRSHFCLVISDMTLML
jgi:hypothetical protein